MTRECSLAGCVLAATRHMRTRGPYVKRALLPIGVVMLSLVARTASATMIDLQGMGKSSAVQVSLNSSTINITAGEYKWGWMGTTPSGYSPTFYSYCVDLLT